MVIMSWRKVCNRLKISRENTNREKKENKGKEKMTSSLCEFGRVSKTRRENLTYEATSQNTERNNEAVLMFSLSLYKGCEENSANNLHGC